MVKFKIEEGDEVLVINGKARYTGKNGVVETIQTAPNGITTHYVVRIEGIPIAIVLSASDLQVTHPQSLKEGLHGWLSN